MRGITIRRLSAGDGPAYRKIRLQALQTAPEAFGASYTVEAAREAAHFEERVTTGCVFGAFNGDEIIGMAGFYRETGLKQRHKGSLWGVFVVPDYRMSGVGTGLVQAVIDHAAEVVDLIALTAVSDNEPVIALYSKLGFRTYGVEPRALKIDGRYFAETLMVRDLD